MKLKNSIIFTLLLFLFTFAANAQEVQENQNTDRQNVRPQRLFEQLGLSREQIQQIRKINRDKQPLMKDAQEKLRDANRALNTAIYADTANEEEVKNRLKDVQTAQSEVLRIRTIIEFELRKVLKAEQLAKFRQLQEDFERNRQERQTTKQNRPNVRRNN